ncbi:MAG: sugar ABC transporter permease [Candidatus Omnitrophica bacterium CG07_land_8_20_14_0_80_50_8]|nr:MAG: sugar ABC transporter permease [Candidatus Omnitrophica bacterium CG07_land_8_20_14_0_80_50_8]
MSYFKARKIIGDTIFILPAFLLFFTFSLYPFFKVFELSATDWDGISRSVQWVGLANFKDLLTENPTFWLSMRNAFYITFLALTAQNLAALFLAWLCDRDIKGGNVYRVIFYLPPVLSGIVVGLIWNWIYDGNYGLLNHFLSFIGLGDLSRAWLSNRKTALTAVAVIHMWKGFGWGFVILLAGLQSIPRELYEAARVDGANGWVVFKNITAPLMIPVFILVSILTILGTMQIFDIIIATTGGGPGYHTEVPITRIVSTMIASSQFGYACAMGVLFGLILLALSMIQIQVSKRVRQV